MFELRPKTKESYCTQICKKYYCFGTSYDKRCSHNDNQSINQCISNCRYFNNAKKQAKMIKNQLDNNYNCTKVTPIDEYKTSWLLAIFEVYNPNKKYWDD